MKNNGGEHRGNGRFQRMVHEFVTVTLSATDTTSTVAATHYTINGGGTQTGTSVSLPTDGTYTVSNGAWDKAGNSETPNTLTVKEDKVAPAVTSLAFARVARSAHRLVQSCGHGRPGL